MMKFGTVPVCPGAAQAGYIKDAWLDVLMRGHAEHFVNGSAGLTWACALSNMVEDPRNIHLFPHPVKKAFFTGKTVCYIMTGEKHRGVFIFVKYAHKLGIQLDMNDAHLSQKIAKETPEVFEQEYLISVPPPKLKKRIKTQSNKRASSPRKPYRPKGAAARAVAAGLMSASTAQGMTQSMSVYERQRLASVVSRKK
jgi:hypothetical protein